MEPKKTKLAQDAIINSVAKWKEEHNSYINPAGEVIVIKDYYHGLDEAQQRRERAIKSLEVLKQDLGLEDNNDVYINANTLFMAGPDNLDKDK